MAKHKMWILSSDEIKNPITGKDGDAALVHSQEDLDRRLKAAQKAGIKVDVREVN